MPTTFLIRATAVLVAGLGSLTLAVGCGQEAAERRAPNVLLLTLDTVRADRLGCYGYEKARTPNLDRLARRGVLFSGARANAPLTLPSHASLLSGTFPTHHGVKLNHNYRVPERLETLAEILQRQGYATGAVIGAIVLDSRFGLAQGFDTYDNIPARQQHRALGNSQRNATEVATAARAWLAERSSPFFLWCHFFDPHFPYAPPGGLRGEGDEYDGEIAYVDLEIGRILDELRNQGLEDDTLVVVVADHGEDLGDHGEASHGFFLYDSVMRIPLLFSGSGLESIAKGKSIPADVSGADLVPTILELFGLPSSERCQGKSLVKLMRGEPDEAPRYHLMETHYPELVYGWSRLEALCEDGWKYVQAPRPELYDLRQDPGERNNLHDEQPDRAAAMKARLEQLQRLHRGPDDEASLGASVDESFQKQLEALGYLTPSGSPVETESRPDPKDMIQGHLQVGKVETLFQQGRTEEGLKVLDETLKKDPGSPFLLMTKARKLLELRRLDESETILLQVLADKPDLSDAYFLLGQIEERRGRDDEALLQFRRAQAGAGQLLEYTYLAAARVLQRTGKTEEALAETDKALALNADYVDGLRLAGELHAELGQGREALLAYVKVAESGAGIAGLGQRLKELFRNAESGKLITGEEKKELARRALEGMPRSRWLKEMVE